MVTQVGLANIIKYFSDALLVSPDRVVLALTTFCFDISMLEIFIALTRGASLVLALGCTQKDPFQIIQLIENFKVTIFQATPTTYEMLLATGWTGDSSIDFLIGGEAFRPSVLPIANNCASMRNVYGPTETSIWSSSFTIRKDVLAYCGKYGIVNAIPIGKVISQTEFYVATEASPTESLTPGQVKWVEVISGEEGELFIGGVGVAAGYLHAPELTVDRFIPNPFTQSDSATNLIYRTGDIVRVVDGNYIFVRRADAQVKIDGYRIEIEEVEAVYKKLPDVEQVVVLVCHNKLVLYIQFHSALSDPHLRQLRLSSVHEEASRTLTTYMQPKYTMLIEQFPTTPNGKLDKNMLPDPPDLVNSLVVINLPQVSLNVNDKSTLIVPSGKSTQRCVSTIVCDIIEGYKGTRPPVTASLAAFGLDSLGAVLLIRQLKNALPDINIKMTDIFAPGVTISSLGKQLFAKASLEQRTELEIVDEGFSQTDKDDNEASLSSVDHFSDALAGNIRLVEGLRGVCTFMVLWNHWHASQTPLSQAFNVDTFLFILISGYTTALQCRLTAFFVREEAEADMTVLPNNKEYFGVSNSEGLGDIELGGPTLTRDSNVQLNIQIVARSRFELKTFLRTKAIGLFPILWFALIMAIPMWISQYRAFHDHDHVSKAPGDDIFGLCIGLYFVGMNEWAANCTNVVPHITYASSLWNILIIFGTLLHVWNIYAIRFEKIVNIPELYRLTSGFTNPTVSIFTNWHYSRQTLKYNVGKCLLYLRFGWYHHTLFSFLLITSIPIITGLFILNAQGQIKLVTYHIAMLLLALICLVVMFL